MRRPLRALPGTAWMLLSLVACASLAAPVQPTPTPAGVAITVRVADAEEYRIHLTDPSDITIAEQLLMGKAAPRIPNGRVVHGDSEVNVGYSWHIDPSSVEFTDVTTEVCDGRPSDVEHGVITSDHYCPWSASVVAITPLEAR